MCKIQTEHVYSFGLCFEFGSERRRVLPNNTERNKQRYKRNKRETEKGEAARRCTRHESEQVGGFGVELGFGFGFGCSDFRSWCWVGDGAELVRSRERARATARHCETRRETARRGEAIASERVSRASRSPRFSSMRQDVPLFSFLVPSLVASRRIAVRVRHHEPMYHACTASRVVVLRVSVLRVWSRCTHLCCIRHVDYRRPNETDVASGDFCSTVSGECTFYSCDKKRREATTFRMRPPSTIRLSRWRRRACSAKASDVSKLAACGNGNGRVLRARPSLACIR